MVFQSLGTIAIPGGPGTAGKWTGHQNCIGNFAGIFAPWISGNAKDKTNTFFAAFAIASAMLLMSVISYWFVVCWPSKCSILKKKPCWPLSLNESQKW